MTPGNPPSLPDRQPDLANLSEEELASNQEGRVVPWFAGARKLAVTWVGPIYNPVVRKLKGKPSELSQIQEMIDPLGALVSGALKGDSQPKTKAFYGSLVGVVCAGPVDELVAFLVNGATVWPGNKSWADGIVEMPTLQRRRKGNKGQLYFADTHGLRHGDKFVVSGCADGSFNEAAAVSATDVNDTSVKWVNAGADVALVDDFGGRLTKVVHYLVGDLIRDGSSVWRCIAAHDGLLSRRPPNVTYWEAYSVKRVEEDNPYAFTVADFGQGYFYWGTATQVLDGSGERLLSQTGHPAYRRQAVLVLKDFLFGAQRQAAPNIEVIVRRAPAQGVIDGEAAGLDGDAQANGLAVVADLLGDGVFGLGLSGLVDVASWQVVADALEGDAAGLYVSPLLERGQAFRAFVGSMLAYYDGWLRWSAAGLIEAGRFAHNEAPPVFTGANTIDFHDCIEEIEFEVDGYASTFNEVVVRFEDSLRAFKDASRKGVSGVNRAIVGEPRQTVLERPAITREGQALQYAVEWAKVNAQPALRGSVTVRAEKAGAIRQGDLFRLTHDAVSLSVVCRCMEKRFIGPPAGRVVLRFESERGIAPIPYAPTGGGPSGTVLPPAGRVTCYQFLQPPPALVGTGDFRICVLHARTSGVLHGIKVWLQKADGDLFYDLGQQTHFAVQGLLAQNYGVVTTALQTHARSRSGNVATIETFLVVNFGGPPSVVNVSGVGGTGYNGDVVATSLAPSEPFKFIYYSPGPDEAATNDFGGTVTPTQILDPEDDSESLQLDLHEFTVRTDLEKVSEGQSADGINDDAVLVFLVSAADPTLFEVCTVKAIRLNAGVYKLKVRRARFGTVQRAFLAGDSAWIVRRDELVAYAHGEFATYAQEGEDAVFRLQAHTLHDEADLADANLCPDISFEFQDPYAPGVEWVALQRRETGNRPPVDWPPVYEDPPGTEIPFADIDTPSDTVGNFDQFRFTLRASSPAGLLSVFKFVARYVDGTEQLIFAKSFAPTAVAQFTFNFVRYGVAPMEYPAFGPPTFYAVVGDWDRRIVEHPFPIALTWVTPI